MKTKHLVIKSRSDNRYLVVGSSYSQDTEPQNWHLPVVANEYGNLNIKDVVMAYTHNLGLDFEVIVDSPEDSHLVFAEVADSKLGEPIEQTDEVELGDENDEFELRKFISKDDLNKILENSIFGRLHL